MGNAHDYGYKFLFSAPEFVRDLIQGFVPDAYLHALDYSTLERVECSYITEDFRSRADDIVWRVKVGSDWVYLYILIEFQSTVDHYMALRMMVYQGLLYQDLIRQGAVLADGRLPPILPIVLYNGNRSWTAATNVSALIPTMPGLVAWFKPSAGFLLIDENAYSDIELASLKNLVATIFRIEHPADPDTVQRLLRLLDEWLADRPDLRRMIALWIRATLMHRHEYSILLPEVNDLQELRIMLADQLEVWAHGYKAEGMQQGMLQGEALALQKLLTKRFGVIPANILTSISFASRAQIEEWFDRAIDADGYTDVFGAY